MDEDCLEGVGKQVIGLIKKPVAKVIGDTKTQAGGTVARTAGKAQNAVGDTNDTIRDPVQE